MNPVQSTARVLVEFVGRDESIAPLTPIAAVGLELGGVAEALAKRLLALSDHELSQLRGVAGDGVLLVLGDANALPWVNGITYLGVDPRAPRLLVPTMLTPNLPIELFEQALLRDLRAEPPIAVLTAAPRLISLAAALPIDRAALQAWLARQPPRAARTREPRGTPT